jgi:6-phosphogluconolactonase (cycloisomerase 2 family)
MRRNPGQVTLAAVSLVCVLLLAACSSSTPTVRYLTISPTTATVPIGGQTTLTVLAYYSNGAIQSGNGLVSWSTSNSAVATVVAGVVTGVGNGSATITAVTAGVAPVSATVTVNQLVSIAVTPLNPSVPVGLTQQFTATGTFNDSSTADLTSTATWASTNTNAATIASGGLATAVATGTTQITAAQYGVTSNMDTLTVTPATSTGLSITAVPSSLNIAIGNTATFTAMETLSDGTTQPPTGTVVWTSGTTTTATIVTNASNSATAIALGLTAGTSVISATEGTLTTMTPPTLTVVTGSTHYAYVSNNTDQTIGWYTVTAGAAPYLTAPSSNTLSQTKSGSFQTVVNPNGQFVYWIDAQPAINVAVVNSSTGALSLPTGTPVAGGSFANLFVGTGGNTQFEAVDPFGRYIYVSDDGGAFAGNITSVGQISEFAINSDGSLTSLGTITTKLDNPESLVIDRTGSYVYAINNTNSTISTYNIGATGALTAASATPIGTSTGPFIAALDPTGTYLYVPCNDGAGTEVVSAFSIGTGGALTSNGNLTVSGASEIFNLVVDPSGKYIYVLDGGPATSLTSPGQVFTYNIGSGGVIGSQVGSAVTTGALPSGAIVIDPTGVLLAVDNNGDNTISVYTVAAGVLTPQSPVGTGQGPLYVTFLNAP